MLLLDNLDQYCLEKELRNSTKSKIRYEVSIWWKHDGPLLIRNITPQIVANWRQTARAAELSPRTIESVISTVRALCKFAGFEIDAGKKLKFDPDPGEIPTLEDLDAVIKKATPWWRRWLAVGYATALRLGDLERLNPFGNELVVHASKTNKKHVFPLPEPIARTCDGGAMKMPRKRLRQELRGLCDSAKVKQFTPQQLRALSASEWERARPGAGAAILGHRPKDWSDATPYYLQLQQQLKLGLPHFRLPHSLLTDAERDEKTSRETMAMNTFRALPETQQRTAVDVLKAMAR